MRPGQNKRIRGRNNNNNRKGPNPLTRSYESNGPDVKVRGTAQHIAEKYLQLARDAQSSGDPVMAESYLQHAEHYYRLIAAAHAAQQPQMSPQPGQPRQPVEVEYDDDDEDPINDRFASVAERLPQPQFPQGVQPQPQFQPPQPAYQERPPYNNGERPQQQERQPRNERPYGDRNDRNNDRNQGQQGQNFNRDNRRFREQRPEQRPIEAQPDIRTQDENRAQPAAEPVVGLPAFITAPPRPIPSDAPQPETVAPEVGDDQQDAGGYHLRPRRRRRGRPAGLVGAAAEGGEFSPAPGGEPDAD
jgi:hypothetical protein